MTRFVAAVLLFLCASPSFAGIVFTCTDPGGCQAPVPTATLVSANSPFSAYRFFWLSADTGAAGLSEPDTMWALGGTWQGFNVEGTARGFFRMQGTGWGLESQFVYDFAGRGDISDSGTWNLSAPVPPPVGVPEPGTLALLGLGLAGAVAGFRRRA
jgi:hypothetical protein